MNTLLVLIGLPASGKSYVAKEHEKFGYVVHSSDKLREELFNDVNFQGDNQAVFKELHKRVKQDLKDGKNVVYDATNINYKRRIAFLNEIKDIPCVKRCLLLATPYEVCVERDKQRERTVGEAVIKRMYTNFYIPQYYEGWDYIDIYFSFDKKEYDSDVLFEYLFLEEQDNPHHTLTIGAHCYKCSDMLIPVIRKNSVAKKRLMEQGGLLNLFSASIYHDIGKRFCKTFNEEKGYCTYYQHHLVSAYNAMFYLKAEEESDDNILKICNYIQWHMQVFSMNTEKSINKFKALVGEEVYEDLLLLHEADTLAK